MRAVKWTTLLELCHELNIKKETTFIAFDVGNLRRKMPEEYCDGRMDIGRTFQMNSLH